MFLVFSELQDSALYVRECQAPPQSGIEKSRGGRNDISPADLPTGR
jgi:hypothetical protein